MVRSHKQKELAKLRDAVIYYLYTGDNEFMLEEIKRNPDLSYNDLGFMFAVSRQRIEQIVREVRNPDFK